MCECEASRNKTVGWLIVEHTPCLRHSDLEMGQQPSKMSSVPHPGLRCLLVCSQSSLPFPGITLGYSLALRAKSLQSCPTLCDPMDCIPPAPLPMGFSRQEYWSGLLCPPPGYLPHPGIEPVCLLCGQMGSLPLAPPGACLNYSP